MFVNTSAFILSILKYKDADAIVKAYTREVGFTTFYVKGLYKSNKSKIKKAYLQPAAIVNLIATQRNKEAMEYIKEISPLYHYKNLHTDFDKLNISIFIREILLSILQQEPADPGLFNFIIREFKNLDKNRFDINFHIYFLIKFLAELGVAPDLNSHGKYFDLQEAVFTNSPASIDLCMNEKQSKLFRSLLGTIFAYKKEINLTNLQRKRILEDLLKYYDLHFAHFTQPKSLSILSSLYS